MRPPEQGRPPRADARRWRRQAALPGVLLAVALGAGLAWRALRSRAPEAAPAAAASPASPSSASIAVLPFADLSPGRDQEYLADGIAEEILSALAQVDGLRVPGRTSSFFFKGKSVRLADLGRELNVDTVLEGSVRRSGNRDAAFDVAVVHAWRGEVEAALDALDRSYASGDPLGEGFSHDPLLRPLRGHPRHTALLRKLNLPTE